MSCATITPNRDQVVDNSGLHALMAHLLAIRSQLDAVLASQNHVQEAVSVLKDNSLALGRGRATLHGSLDGPPRGAISARPPADSMDEDADSVQYEQVQYNLDQELKKVEAKYVETVDANLEFIPHKSYKDELTDLMLKAEYEENTGFKYRHMTWREKVKTMTASQKGALIDALTGALVIANTVVIGLSADDVGWVGWQWLDVCFTLGFLSEMIAKMIIQGFFVYFRDQWHWLDCGLVFFDLVQTVMWIASVDTASDAFALARVVRVARLSRICRVLRVSFSQNLVRMTSAIAGSLTTILWGSILLILTVYVMAIVFRETVGRSDLQYETTGKYFDSVPRSTLTLFRCAFGECTTNTGYPIFEYINDFHGVGLVAAWGCFISFVILGLFNVITSIFIEKMMVAAHKEEKTEQSKRLMDESLWATRIAKLLRVVWRLVDPQWDGELSEDVESLLEVSLSPKEFHALVKDEYAAKALDELDVSREDHGFLCTILDPENRKAVSVREIVQGIQRIRGEPRRSDIVAVGLVVRSIKTQMGVLAT